MQKDPDEALIRRCLSEDAGVAEVAFEELYGRYRDRVYGLACRLVGDLADAEDVTQEAFVTVYRKLADFRFSSRFYTWLYRVVFNLCVDQNRRRGQGPLVARTEALEGLEFLPDSGPAPDQEVAEREARTLAVERALRRLSTPLRAVVILRYLEELQYHE
ncbi:MAG TPA: sigma-70 family RNA polymerase sigma factor, partial [Candidatus Polarisedimenticolia bacterium]|nr:sigma-70 family RNA polymerase sigma factor [Candidatus Polarisedimenticolia bacterium]